MNQEEFNLRWEKSGLIFCPNESLWWSKTHAQCPVINNLADENGYFDIYYSSRDKENCSRIGHFKFDFKTSQVMQVSELPVLDLGNLGCFDDSGVMPTSIFKYKDETYLFYIGWTRRIKTPYQNSIGIARKVEDGSFRRVFEGPIISPNKNEPYFTGTANIIQLEDYFVCYYLSCTGWVSTNGEIEPTYNIKLATSNDLFNWSLNGKIAIDLQSPDEGGVASASVYQSSSSYFMWYCYRGKFNYRDDITKSYRIGLAVSNDAINWKRVDAVNQIDLGQQGDWDSTMQCYPNVFRLGQELCMLYNGNGFGASGVGLAKLPLSEIEKNCIEN